MQPISRTRHDKNVLDKAPDVAAFAKNAGPQAVRIDYLTADHRLAFYTPDFFARDPEGAYFLIETKGRQDQDVPRKASAAIEWCKTASKSATRWHYVFVPQAIMEGLTSSRFCRSHASLRAGAAKPAE